MLVELMYMGKVFFRLLLAVSMGSVIGTERAKNGQSAGVRTHLLVCLGSALSALISVYLDEVLGSTGDMTRISAQVISGIGFLGAGMIMIKNNSVIKGLTTAAGVWTTGIIGIALGYGFYYGAAIAFALFLAANITFSRLEQSHTSRVSAYVEIDDMYATNKVIAQMKETFGKGFTYKITAARSGNVAHLGINIVIDKKLNYDVVNLCEMEHIVYVDEEE